MWPCPYTPDTQAPSQGLQTDGSPFLPTLCSCPEGSLTQQWSHTFTPFTSVPGSRLPERDAQTKASFWNFPCRPRAGAKPRGTNSSFLLAWPPLQRAVLTHSYCSQPLAGKSTCKTGRDTGLSQKSFTPTSQKAPGGPSSKQWEHQAVTRLGCRKHRGKLSTGEPAKGASWPPTDGLMDPSQLLKYIY